MAKIDSYATATPPISGGDKMIGTDVNDNNSTKNFTVNQFIQFINDSAVFVPYTGATGPVDLGSNLLTVDNASFQGGIQVTNIQMGAGNFFAPNTKFVLGFSTGTAGQVLTSGGPSAGVYWSSGATLEGVLSNGHSLTNELNFQGTNAGLGTTGTNINAFGLGAAANNINKDNVNALGYYAAVNNSGNSVNAIGYHSCSNNTGYQVTAIGDETANTNSGNNVVAIGESAASGNSGDNVIALGYYAGSNNTISNAIIISSSDLPSYVDFAAASAAITIAAGASSNCTYLYHDQSTNSIGAVRIP